MNKTRIAFILIPIIWLLAIWGIVGYKEYQLAVGREIVLKTLPVDPRDIFRGEYVTLRYEISRINLYESSQFDTPRYDSLNTNQSKYKVGDTVYVILNDDGSIENPYYPDASVMESLPEENKLFIKGKITDVQTVRKTLSMDSTISIEYGIESYFVPEGQGREIEKRARDGNLNVRVVIDRYGNATIKSLE